MNKIFAAFVGLVCHLSLCAQYDIAPIAPPQNFTFNDLWHFNVLRAANDHYKQFYISLRLYESGALKVKSNTKTLLLPVGSQYYNLNNIIDLQPFQTSYYSADILQQTIASGGFFPPGTYQAMYTLYGRADDGEFVPLAENTSEVMVEAMWPPMLLNPGNGDTIDSPNPILTWTPAFSSSFIGPIMYQLNLVELFDGQNEYQAIQSNPLHFTENNIANTMLPYPAGGQILDTGKVYAWQIHANAQGTDMGHSEIWTFRLKSPEAPTTPTLPRSFFRLAENLPAEYVQVDGNYLPLAIDERYHSTSGNLKFTIFDSNAKPIGTEKDYGEAIQAGLNLYSISICSTNSKISLKKGNYIIEVITEKNNKLYLAFEINKKNCHAE